MKTPSLRFLAFLAAGVCMFLAGCVVVRGHPHGGPPGRLKRTVVVAPAPKKVVVVAPARNKHVFKAPGAGVQASVQVKVTR